jgi:hypothetical protein
MWNQTRPRIFLVFLILPLRWQVVAVLAAAVVVAQLFEVKMECSS